MEQAHSTTILCIKSKDKTIMIGDGQVSLGHTVLKSNAHKVKYLDKNKTIIAGFAGASADAFALFERLEVKLEMYSGQLKRACIELAKDWRTDKYLRKLEAMMIVANKESILLMSGNGEVIEPDDNIIAIGSGGNYALAAAKALTQGKSSLTDEEIVKLSMKIAADVCIYTNHNFVIETINH